MSAACATRRHRHHRAWNRAARDGHPAGDLVPFFIVVGVLFLIARPVAAIVAFFWGLSLAGRFARRVVEPEIRRHYVERETERGLSREVPRERRERGEQHAREVGALFASVADGIRDPLRGAQGLVRQMGEDPGSPRNVEHARLALGELDKVEASIARLLSVARSRAQGRAGEERA
jgi:signal transduction histidine kinase